MTLGYSLLHFLTDGLCAFAMFGRFSSSPDWYIYMLLYNFCAFALQLPFGAVVDVILERCRKVHTRVPFFTCVLGLFLTVSGAFTHPVILGLGNALFHVGGGIDTMREDRRKKKKGALLGIFVSPGAVGLYLGTVFGKGELSEHYALSVFVLGILMALSAAALYFYLRRNDREDTGNDETVLLNASDKKDAVSVKMLLLAAVLLFTVVVIRSYTGMNVPFSWKQGFVMGLICVIAVASGKACGGILSALFGMKRVMITTLILSAVLYYFSSLPVCGVLALFTFNMTMPMTLYLLAEKTPEYSGTAFGLLTLALFVGFLPAWGRVKPLMTGNLLGAVMSLISLVLLLTALTLIRKEGRS